MQSQDQCSPVKPSETIDGLYKSRPDRSNDLQFKQFQCCNNFMLNDFRSLFVLGR